jgi:hypothetical protein
MVLWTELTRGARGAGCMWEDMLTRMEHKEWLSTSLPVSEGCMAGGVCMCVSVLRGG